MVMDFSIVSTTNLLQLTRLIAVFHRGKVPKTRAGALLVEKQVMASGTTQKYY